MPNKLRDIFSNEMVELKCKVCFKDNESYKEFFKVLEKVQNDGDTVKVDGVSLLNTSVKDGKTKYPLLEQIKPFQIIIKPSTNNIDFPLDTEYGKKTILFKRYYTTKEIILETNDNEIIYLKIAFIKNTIDFTFSCRIQPEFAKTLKDIIESHSTIISFMEKMFDIEDIKDSENLSADIKSIYEMKNSFLVSEAFFKRLYLMEQEFQIFLDPSKINDTENDDGKLEELYLLIVEKKVIRLNRKLTESETKVRLMEAKGCKLEVGSTLDVTFLRELEYTICGQKIIVYTANLLSNAIIKEIKEDENNDIKVLYDDTDSQPMYISYTGFKTVNEAEQELANIINHKEKYRDALTLDEYLKN